MKALKNIVCLIHKEKEVIHMADIVVNKEVVLGEVMKNETQKYVVSQVDSSVGEFISIQQRYLKDGSTEWNKGKGQWLPLALGKEIAELMLAAYK